MFLECFHDFTLRHGLALSLFLAGLVGSATHCAPMCGPFVLAQTGDVKKLSGALLLPYHLGRMTTYVALAVLFNTVLNLAFLFLPVKNFVVVPLLVLAGIVFLVNAFPVLGHIFPWAFRLRSSFSLGFMPRIVRKLTRAQSLLGRYALGVALGFVPCGLVLSAVMAASSAPTPLMAGLAMASFAVGTIPALLLVALGGRFVLLKYPEAMGRMRQGALALSGAWLFVLASFFVL